MPGRTARTVPARPANRTLIGAGAAGLAGLAGVIALAPAAHAAPTDTPSSTTSDATGSATTTPRKVAAEVAPVYGTQKYRVGVQVKDGSYVPAGTTTAGTVLTITTAEPADGDTAASSTTTTCTTDASTIEKDSTASYCLVPKSVQPASRKAAAKTAPYNIFDVPFDQQFIAPAGATVTITQKTVNANLLIDPSVGTITPCEIPTSQSLPICVDGEDFKGTSVVFDDPGLPPVAGADSATTKEGVAVPIAIEGNDTPKAPVKGVAISADPKHGTARLYSTEIPDPAPSSSAPTSPSDTPLPTLSTITLDALNKHAVAGARSLASVSSYRAVYTPAAGFVGTDTFRYTITTANGTATALVTVRVTADAASASVSATDASSSASSGTAPLADTGTQSSDLLGYAAALLAAGGGALAIGRQRRRGRHAR